MIAVYCCKQYGLFDLVNINESVKEWRIEQIFINTVAAGYADKPSVATMLP
jgi:hypothetical protein